MGLGKTVQSIAAVLAGLDAAAAAGTAPPPPALVVAPASLLANWRAEIGVWAPGLTIAIYRGTAAEREAVWEALKPLSRTRGTRTAARAHVVLTTYEYALADGDADRLLALDWGWLFVDEAHARLASGTTKVGGE